MDVLQVALSWLENGWTILPIAYRSKRPDFRALRDTGYVGAGGRPVWDPLKESPPSIEAVTAWFSRPCNLGVITGWRNLVVVDFDHREAYDAWLSWCQEEGGIAADIAGATYRVVSARGMHVYLVVEDPVESWSIPGMLDVKGRYGYVVCPPSIHTSGHQYQGYGKMIMHCEVLRQVFPFEKPVVELSPSPMVMLNDPYEVASRMVECGGPGIVDRILQRITVWDLLGIQPNGKRWAMINCPLHNDTNPSFRIYPDGDWRCFGSCNAHGDAIDLFAALNRLTTREAISELGSRLCS